jgi:preprotein translocase subunit SecA
MVFFDSRETLLRFYNHVLMDSLRTKTEIVTEATSKSLKDSIFVRATERGAITLLVRDFGRGTDFKCYDTRVLDVGGVHVIQAFFSDALSEEIQIKGRCARQGAAGSYR